MRQTVSGIIYVATVADVTVDVDAAALHTAARRTTGISSPPLWNS